ncbi:hypothetical protein MHTCC0001_15830 [Flavobacteriaceae bacterium MHTCC 0001]
MAPIKFEDDFKDKLQKRSITPSKGAWERLSERLDNEHEAPRNRKVYWWMGVAASVIGVLFMVSHMFNTNIEVNPTIVDTNNIDTLNIYTDAPIIEDMQSVPTVMVQTENLPSNIKPKPKKGVVANARTAIVEADAKDEKLKADKDLQKTLTMKEQIFEAKKAQEVADAIYNLSEKEAGVSNATIDSLLKAAQRAILIDRMKGEDKVAVDAALLLQEVEDELDKSFRDKVFKTLKESYGSVKTAIAQRND